MAGKNSSADVLSAAWDAAENAEETPTTEQTEQELAPEASGEAQEEEIAAAPDEGEGEKPAEDAPTQAAKKVPPKPGKGDDATSRPNNTAQAKADEPKAPQSWPAAVRQHWASLPQEVRATVTKREREAKQAIDISAEARRTVGALNNVLAPHLPHLQEMKVEPLAAIEELFQAHHVLRAGSKEHKAQLVANFIKNFDVDVPTIAAKLDGGKSPQQTETPSPAPQPKPEDFKDPRLDVVLSAVQKRAQARVAEKVEKEKAELSALQSSGEAEFLHDVLPDMLELSKIPRNSSLSMAQLYEKACLLNDDVRPLWEQRKAAKAAATARATTQRRSVSSSVRHEPTAPPSGVKPTSRREQLEELYDKLSR